MQRNRKENARSQRVDRACVDRQQPAMKQKQRVAPSPRSSPHPPIASSQGLVTNNHQNDSRFVGHVRRLPRALSPPSIDRVPATCNATRGLSSSTHLSLSVRHVTGRRPPGASGRACGADRIQPPRGVSHTVPASDKLLSCRSVGRQRSEQRPKKAVVYAWEQATARCVHRRLHRSAGPPPPPGRAALLVCGAMCVCVCVCV
jgi:hypothetical protein